MTRQKLAAQMVEFAHCELSTFIVQSQEGNGQLFPELSDRKQLGEKVYYKLRAFWKFYHFENYFVYL